MAEISERQKLILSLVIHEYARTVTPVGSNALVKRYQLEFSSATVRNDLAVLTEENYLRQPHTSAGRVPTAKGYRFFVSGLMHNQELSIEKRRIIMKQFSQARNEIDGWMKLAASILASHSQAASLVSAPLPHQTNLKRIALLSISGRQILMVLALHGGKISQRFIYTDDIASQESLTELENEINGVFSGKTTLEIHGQLGSIERKSPITELILQNMIQAMYESNEIKTGEVYTDGISNVLMEPEFAESEDARRALKILDEKPILQKVLSRIDLEQRIGGIQVYIGDEGISDSLKNCSMVLARYGNPGIISGTVGVLGPIRMAYGRNIPTVRFIASVLSDFVTDSSME